MGGRIAITVRASETEQWRGSCWTNILPLGLFTAEFYADIERSRRHSWAWVQGLWERRAAEPGLEGMWGGHGMLAPTGYGIVVVDYVSRSLVSAQGYCSADSIILFGDDSFTFEADLRAKWDALEAMDLLTRKPWPGSDADGPAWPSGWRCADIRLPFEHVRAGHEDLIDTAMLDWAEKTLGLSDDERACWSAWLGERAGD